MSGLRRRLGVTVPIGVVVVAGAVLAGTVLASAAPPSLPHRSQAQLLARMRDAALPPAMTAVVSENANLGLPALPDVGPMSSATSAMSLLTGSHTVDIWYAGPRHLRVAMPVPFGETDLRVNGRQIWLWDSHGQKATHFESPIMRTPVRSDRRDMAALTPMQWAARVLALVGPTTKVTVDGTATIAGRPAYQLAIAPRSGRSLVGRVLVAVDATTYLPLQVQIFARGSSSPAVQVGFSSLSFSRPAMSNFTFTPPPGAHVRVVRPPANLPGRLPGAMGPVGKPGAPRSAISRTQPGAAGPMTFGTGWLTVVAISARQALGRSGPTGHLPGLIGPLLKTAAQVRGSWGSGRLLRTSLLSVLVTSKGQVLAGAVTPAVLYADAAKVK